MNFRKFISGVGAVAIAASAFAAMTVTASAETASYNWVVNDGTYGYAAVITDTAPYLNTALGEAAVSGGQVNQSRGSGIYSVFDSVLEPTDNELTIEFGMDLVGGQASGTAGDTTQTICFMSAEYKPSGNKLQSVPASNVLFTLSKTSGGDVYLNGTEALNIPNDYKDAQNLGSITARNSTGLVKYKAVINFDANTVDIYADTASGYGAAVSADLMTTGADGLYGIFAHSSNKRANCGFVMTDIEYTPAPVVTEEKGMLFEAVELSTLAEKTLTVTIDYNDDTQVKSNVIGDLSVSLPTATGAANIAWIITGVPVDATVVSAVIE